MKGISKVEEYINRFEGANEINKALRQLALNQTELEETIKWGIPCYTFNDKNVFGFAVFKNFTSIWFYQGVDLTDPANALSNAQEGKTKAMRQWRFNDITQLDRDLPPIFQSLVDDDDSLKCIFDQFPRYKQKEFIEYIAEAKIDTTKQRRLNKIMLLIQSGTGLNDKYRK